MCSFPSLLEELLACCGYNERTVCVPFLQIENSSAIVVKIEPSWPGRTFTEKQKKKRIMCAEDNYSGGLKCQLIFRASQSFVLF